MRRVTGKDVAQRAGVTAATVSYVLSGSSKQSVSKETRERVIEAARELGYIPDRNAKTLRVRQSNTIGVVIKKSIATPRFAATLQGMVQAASRLGYRLTICRNHMVESSGLTDYLTTYYERFIDGIVFIGRDNEGPDSASLAIVERDAIPFVILDCQNANPAIGSVDFDYRRGAFEVTTRALAMRKGRVLYVRPEAENAQERLREEGVRAACAAAGVGEPAVVYVPIRRETIEAYDKDEQYADMLGSVTRDDFMRLAEMVQTSIASSTKRGDVIVCSWADWSGIFRRASNDYVSVYADLANSMQSAFSADVYGILPSMESGERCVEQLVEQIAGKPAVQTVLPVFPRVSELMDAPPASQAT